MTRSNNSKLLPSICSMHGMAYLSFYSLCTWCHILSAEQIVKNVMEASESMSFFSFLRGGSSWPQPDGFGRPSNLVSFYTIFSFSQADRHWYGRVNAWCLINIWLQLLAVVFGETDWKDSWSPIPWVWETLYVMNSETGSFQTPLRTLCKIKLRETVSIQYPISGRYRQKMLGRISKHTKNKSKQM